MQPGPTPDPQLQADIDFVVREFSNHVRRNEIKQSMMERRNLTWNEAEQFVSYVESNHRRSIAVRQLPLFVVLAIGSLVGGCALLSYTGVRLIDGIPESPFVMRRLFGGLMTGGTMFLGGIVGFWQTFAALHK